MIVHQFNSNALLDVHDFVMHFRVPTIEATLLCRQLSNPKAFASYGIEFQQDADTLLWTPHVSRSISAFNVVPTPPDYLWNELTTWAARDCDRLVRWLLKCPTPYRRALRPALLDAILTPDEEE